jgi:hypothetical protein
MQPASVRQCWSAGSRCLTAIVSSGNSPGKIHALGARPLFELFRELDAGASLLSTLRRSADLLPLAGFVERMGGRDLP